MVQSAQNFLFLFLVFIGVLLFYSLVLVSTVQQSQWAARIPASPLFWIPFPFRSIHSLKYTSQCYTVGAHQLSVLYIAVCKCQSQFSNSSYPPFLPPVSTRLFSASVSLFLLCKYAHLYHFSRFHIYALIYDICFSLSDLLHSVGQSLRQKNKTYRIFF